MQLTKLAKDFIASSPLASPLAIDGTCGNGHDTVFLARLVGKSGHVHAFDSQALAISASQQYLDTESLSSRVSLHEISHADMLEVLPNYCIGKIGAGMFNLGYLPGSNRLHTTKSESTVKALTICCSTLSLGGKMSILCYPGHAAGVEETEAVLSWFASLDNEYFDCKQPIRNKHPKSPILLCLTRCA